jgi:hypothetical protein
VASMGAATPAVSIGVNRAAGPLVY